MDKKLIYFIGSDLRVSEETLKEVSKIEGFDTVYNAFSGALLPSDGYVAMFSVKDEIDGIRVKRELEKIKGVEGPTLIMFGLAI